MKFISAVAIASLAVVAISAYSWAESDEPSSKFIATEQAKEMPSHVAGESDEDRESFQVLPGYKVERLFTVPRDKMGSWVSLATDDQGRLLAADQGDKGIYRITPAPLDGSAPTKVERLDLRAHAVQGMLHAFDSLYLVVNSRAGRPDEKGLISGLYRARDTDGDDQYDEIVRLKALPGAGEHGPHAVRLSPDGKSLVVVCGNHTDPPFDRKADANDPNFQGAVPLNWEEDLLLPRQWDAGGHAVGRYAPGGWIAEVDPDGKSWKLLSVGYRNAYDFDFNAEGDLFAYDSDMEWDMGLPWYRPTRVMHATSGSEFGWRSGTGKWPDYYPDSLPATIDTGPGSPVGVAFGSGAAIPAKYQQALLICDWTFGTIYALHLTPKGSTYTAEKEEFLSRPALPLTDLVVGKDGALYFTTGGRGAQSELYRVTYVGDESTAPVSTAQAAQSADECAALRALRRKLESYHGRSIDDRDEAQSAIADVIWPNLAHDDRFIRFAARVALEFQPLELWLDRALAEQNPQALITATIAVARRADSSKLPALVEALGRLDYKELSLSQQLELLRAYQLAFARLGAPDDATREKLAEKFDAHYPSENDLLNRELCNLLVYLGSPNVVSRTMALIDATPNSSARDDESLKGLLDRNERYAAPIRGMLGNRPDPQKIHYAFALRNVKNGWTLDERGKYFNFLRKAARSQGGNSFEGFLKNIDREAFENASAEEQIQISNAGLRPPFGSPELPKPAGPGRDWTVDQVVELVGAKLHDRNFENGKKMFAAARCVVCHRFAGEGGSTGPDLTQLSGRFNAKDLTEAIIDPSKVISDQYQATTIIADGRSYSGRIVGEQKDKLMILTNPEDNTQVATIRKDTIELQQPSKLSLMPTDLLKSLNEEEVLDLMAYLLSRGNAEDAMFRAEAVKPAAASDARAESK